MKKFHFKLEALLKVRIQQVKKLERELAELQRKSAWYAARIHSIHHEMEQTEKELIQARKRGDLNTQREYQSYLQTLREAIPHLEKAIVKQAELIRAKQELLKDALAERKIVEKLKETQYATWQKSQLSHEESLLDEQITLKH